MNYAWANPLTGLREQTSPGTPERMLAEAKWRAWTELEGIWTDDLTPSVQIYGQEPIGSVTVDGLSISAPRAHLAEKEHPEHMFAWSNPETGKRQVVDLLATWSGQLAEQLKRLQSERDPINEVVIYATWPECTVSQSDPMPEKPEDQPLLFAAAESDDSDPTDSEIRQRKNALGELTIMDDATAIAMQTAWALLDIAEQLHRIAPRAHEIADAMLYLPDLVDKRPRHRRRYRGIEPFRSIRLWWLKLWGNGGPTEPPSKQDKTLMRDPKIDEYR